MATTYYPLSDLLYRSTALTDDSGNIKEAYDADAYGNTQMYSGPGTDGEWFTDDDVSTLQPTCEYIFQGRQYDPESQIYFNRARYYHPVLGRFMSRDPLFNIGLNHNEDPYGYAVPMKSAGTATATDSLNWIYLHQGGRTDTATGLQNFRHWDYSPGLVRWMQSDPEEYIDGANLYAYLRCNPVVINDPQGTCACQLNIIYPPNPPTKRQVYYDAVVMITEYGTCVHDTCPDFCLSSTCETDVYFEAEVWPIKFTPGIPGPVGPSGQFWEIIREVHIFGCAGT